MPTCAIALTGCASSSGDAVVADPAPPPAPYVAGTRLQPVVLDAGDGAEVFAGFWDTELQLTCWFQLMADGTYQCVPDPSMPAIAVFTDASCSASAFATCRDVDSVATINSGICGLTINSAYRLEGNVDGPAFSMVGPECVEEDSIFPEVRAVAPVATDAFVHGTRGVVGVRGSLGVARITGEDGSAVTVGLTRDGHDCVPMSLGGELRCLDDDFVRRNDLPTFADPSCSGQEVALFGTRSCPGGPDRRPGVLIEWPQGNCAAPRLFALGDEIEHAYVAADLCRELESDERFVLIGHEIAPTDLPLVSRIESGTGRLRAVSFGVGDAPLVTRGLFHDTTLDADCIPSRTASGEWRCAPGALQPEMYADPDCKEPLFPSGYGTEDCSGESPGFATIEPSVCDPGALYERGEPYTGDVYVYSDSPGVGCQGPMPNDPKIYGKLYRLGAQIPTTELGLLTRTK